MSKEKIIFICHGNICRSPMAEFIFLYEINKIGLSHLYEVNSRAVSYEEEGNDIDYRAKKILEKYSIPFSSHKAHRISLEEFKNANQIYTMDNSNIKALIRLFPNEDHSKVKLLNYPDEISDPWYSHNFELAFLQIRHGVANLLSSLVKTR